MKKYLIDSINHEIEISGDSVNAKLKAQVMAQEMADKWRETVSLTEIMGKRRKVIQNLNPNTYVD